MASFNEYSIGKFDMGGFEEYSSYSPYASIWIPTWRHTAERPSANSLKELRG